MARNNPPQPAVTGTVIQLAIQFGYQGQTCENIQHWMAGTGPTTPTPTELQSFLSVWQSQNEANLKACLCSDVTITNYFAADVNPGMCPTAILPAGVAGTIAGHGYPTFVSAVCRLQTLLKGQRGRGRQYLPGVALSLVTPATDPDHLNSVAVFQTYLTGLLSSVIATGLGTFKLAVCTRPAPPALLVTTGAQVTSAVPDFLLGTTRRRILGRGI